ncbi:MAG: hypothetical protein A2Y74_09520, partial [Actinobacteria bacterium RBG_13_63_9]
MGAHKGWMITVAAVLLLGLAGVVGVGGCGESESATETTVAYGSPRYDSGVAESAAGDEAAYAPEASENYGIDQAVVGTLAALQAGTDQKIIANAQLEIEVEAGKFQEVFNQALLLADRYGGYVFSSDSYASGEEDSMKSGTIAIRIPATAFDNALSDAGKLGEVKNQSIQTEDVTEEYVDLQARIINSEAHVNAILEVLAQAKTIDEILQVRQVLTSAQAELEQLRGRLRYLDEHTSYSTLTMSIYETGVEVTPTTEWGFAQALKDALHNLVQAFGSIVRGLGWLIPVVIILGIIAYIVYRIVRAAARRRREREQAQAQAQALYQSYLPQGWTGPVGAAGQSGAVPGAP